ncbi:hypothetical protein ATX28_09255 [Oenococcus oeni]|nr:hypothetical protein ATX28_09255 [Oenococcus oeni]
MTVTSTQSINLFIKNQHLSFFILAHKIGINRSTLWSWLKFENELTPERKTKILNAIEELINENR